MNKTNRPYKILVVEDNPGDYLIVEDFLNEEMIVPEITNAVNYKNAAAILTQKPSYFDIILLDVSLPDRSGNSLITDMLRLAGNCPVVVLSGYVDMPFSIQSISHGVLDYLLKDELTPAILYKGIIYAIERKKVLLALKESEKRYSDLFHLSPQPMLLYHESNLRILDANQSAMDTYGYTHEELLQLSVSDLEQADHDPAVAEENGKLQWKDSPMFERLAHHRKKDGTVFQVEIYLNAVIWKDISAKLLLVNNITERMNYIHAIERQNAQLREIAWIHSHIIRAPLARMMGIVNLFKEIETPVAEQQELLQHFLDSSKEIDAVIKLITEKTCKMQY